jgi:hypothetical protein
MQFCFENEEWSILIMNKDIRQSPSSKTTEKLDFRLFDIKNNWIRGNSGPIPLINNPFHLGIGSNKMELTHPT